MKNLEIQKLRMKEVKGAEERVTLAEVGAAGTLARGAEKDARSKSALGRERGVGIMKSTGNEPR